MKNAIGDFVWGRHPVYGHLFDYLMIFIILMSISAMAIETLPDFPEEKSGFILVIDWIVVVIFTIEYGLRYWTSKNRLRYVFSFWGLIDIIAVAPFWGWLLFGLPGGNMLFTLRVLRIAKLLRFVANMELMQRVFELIWREMLTFFFLAVLIMICTAVGIYNFENAAQPEAFPSIPHSFWFAVTSLTTVGYGDIYPITPGGKFFTFIILMVGLGIVALPVGLVSSAFTQARQEERRRQADIKANRQRVEAEKEAVRMEADPD